MHIKTDISLDLKLRYFSLEMHEICFDGMSEM